MEATVVKSQEAVEDYEDGPLVESAEQQPTLVLEKEVTEQEVHHSKHFSPLDPDAFLRRDDYEELI